MIRDARDAMTRSAPTLAQDFLGAAALVVLLLTALHLPAML